MDEIRKYFEEITLSSFGGDECIYDYENEKRIFPKKVNGEYVSSIIEDHWQTFQEGWEAATEFMKMKK